MEIKKKKSGGGFTLIELLLVLAIIGLMSSIAWVYTTGVREKAKITKAQEDIRQIYNAIAILDSNTEQWPDHKTPFLIQEGAADNEICSDGCIFSLSDPRAGLSATDGNFPGWAGPYLAAIPKDPWGKEYFFDTDYDVQPGAGEIWAAVIGSYGPNGAGLNQYDSDDVIFIVISE